jgi:hypothetical protein
VRAALWCLLLVIAAGAAGCGGGGSGGSGTATESRIETTDSGVVIATREDPATGLVFEIQSSRKYGYSSDLYIHLADDAPDSTLARVEGKMVAFTCSAPGVEISYFPQRWKRGEKRVGTALLTKPDDADVASNATDCGFYLPKPGPQPGTVEFSGAPFSSVSFDR